MNRSILIIAICLLIAVACLLNISGHTRLITNAQAVNTLAAFTGGSAEENSRDVLIPARKATSAPAFEKGTWINTEPLELKELRGRVVLVEFWTYGCYNCRNTLPTVKNLDARYRERGLTVVGVHTPETGSERNLDNVRNQVRKLGITYPVVTDNNGDTWRAYDIEAWPTIVVLDKQGRIRWTHIGEGMYDETEGVIKKLLAE